MDISAIFSQLGIALGLGLLVGLQRQRVDSKLAGVRTFPLVTIFGTLCGLLAQPLGGWVVGAAFLALTAIIVIGNVAKLKDGTVNPGVTTEVAVLLMFGVGVYLTVGSPGVAIAVGGGAAVLLQFKVQMHKLVAKLGEEDLTAIMQFALISLVILPVVPNRTYGPYAVLNPRQIWWMVVLIVGISLGGYIAYKFLGEKLGIVLGGILGGLVSSTATTVSFARRTAKAPESTPAAAVVIMLASTVVVVRMMVEVAIVSPSFLRAAWAPLALMLIVFIALSAALWFFGAREEAELPPQENPSELKSALLFGVIYAVVLFAVAAAKEQFGAGGLFIVAGISGLTDVDAITLSTSQLVDGGRLEADAGWKVVIVALLSNLVFKALSIFALGCRQLFLKVSALYGVALATGVLLLLLW